MASKVVVDEDGRSYRLPNFIQYPESRGPPAYEFPENIGTLISCLPWQFTLIESPWNHVTASVFKVYMSHAEAEATDRELAFVQPSDSLSYYEQHERCQERSIVQHVVLPSTYGPPGKTQTSLRITNGGNTEQFHYEYGLYRNIAPFEFFVVKTIPEGFAWCVTLELDLCMKEAEDTSLRCYPEIAEDIVTPPNWWMDTLQIQIVHSTEPKYLTVALRVIDTDAHEILGARYVKPMVFEVTDIEIVDEVIVGNLIKTRCCLELSRMIETDGSLTFPLEYIDEAECLQSGGLEDS